MSAPTTTPLDAAREHLRSLCSAANQTDNWLLARWLDPLHDVADMVCRVGDHGQTSPHYQADKGSDMVVAAVQVRREAFYRYGGYFDLPDSAPDPVGDLTDLTVAVERAAESVMWAVTRESQSGRRVPCVPADTAGGLIDAARALVRWAESLSTYLEED